MLSAGNPTISSFGSAPFLSTEPSRLQLHVNSGAGHVLEMTAPAGQAHAVLTYTSIIGTGAYIQNFGNIDRPAGIEPGASGIVDLLAGSIAPEPRMVLFAVERQAD
jgi:hypothetical protein